MHSVKLADGTELKDLGLNGNNFISKTIIDDEVFENNLDEVTITNDDGTTEEYKDMKLVKNKACGGQSWFVLSGKSKKEKLEESLDDLWESYLEDGGLI